MRTPSFDVKSLDEKALYVGIYGTLKLLSIQVSEV